MALMGPLAALLQAGTEPRGPLDWTLRNWLGLLCQVVAFVLLVSLIFWLANIGAEEEKETGPGGKPPPEVAPGAPAPGPSGPPGPAA